MEIGQESEPMTSHEGKRYTCFLPVEETKTMKSMLPQNVVIIESERRITPKEPDELLEVLKDQCFYREFLLQGASPMAIKMKGIFKGLKIISQIFVHKEHEM